MWGTDGVRVFTVDLHRREHWNAECVGYVGKRGDRLQPPCSRSVVWLDRGRRGSGAGLAIRLPVSVGPLESDPADFLGHRIGLIEVSKEDRNMTDNFEKKVAVDGPVVNAGELGSSTFSPGQALPAGPGFAGRPAGTWPAMDGGAQA